MVDYWHFKKEILNILNNIGLSEEAFNVFSGPIHFDGLYYENHGLQYRYAYFERGTIKILCETESFDEIKYCILRDIIKNYAIDYELQNRLWYKDTRRGWMDKSLELLEKVDYQYYEKLLDEYNEMLKNHPLNDELAIRQNILYELYKVISKINITHNFKLKRNIKAIKSEIKKIVDCSLKYDNKIIIDIINKTTDLYKEIKLCDTHLDYSIKTNLDFILSIDLNFLRSN